MFKVILLLFIALSNLPSITPCVLLYGQCAGIGYNGETQCCSGSTCQYNNDYYSQCLTGTASTTKPTPTPVTANTTQASTGCNALYSQCGGQNWPGSTCCINSVCVKSNDYYSQCLQTSPTSSTSSTQPSLLAASSAASTKSSTPAASSASSAKPSTAAPSSTSSAKPSTPAASSASSAKPSTPAPSSASSAKPSTPAASSASSAKPSTPAPSSASSAKPSTPAASSAKPSTPAASSASSAKPSTPAASLASSAKPSTAAPSSASSVKPSTPAASSASSTTPSTTAASSTTSTNGGSQGCSAIYNQCGGVNWAGPTQCCSGSACQYGNPYYSQCLPISGASTSSSSTAQTPSSSSATAKSSTVSAGNDGRADGVTTRYWDCCKASCGWSGKATVTSPVKTCASDGTTQVDVNAQSGCNGGPGYMCNNQQPWNISATLSYGYAAAHISGQAESDWCCACYSLIFTGGPVAGQELIVQVTNTGGDLGNNHFDLQMPGGGVGIFDGCSSQFPGSYSWGQRYGGVSQRTDCYNLPSVLQSGCLWRFDWFMNADNPPMRFKQVTCPAVLTANTGCIRQ